MSDRSGSPSSEGEGDQVRPYGDDRDSSEESSEEDPEEARRIAEGFIVDEDDDEEDGDFEDKPEAEETKEERRRRRRKEKHRRRKEREERKRAEEELSDDELALLQANQSLAGPSHDRPLKRLKRREGEDGDDELPTLQDIFREDEGRGGMDDEDEDDLGDFIEEDEEEERAAGETEEQRRQRKREEKLKRREAARARPDMAGLDRVAFDENYAVFGDGMDFDWALDGDDEAYEDEEEAPKKDLRLEDVFDPAEIKARRLQDEDKAIAQNDRPERHQLVNSTLSDNPVIAADTLYPPPDLAAGWAYAKISTRTQYLFCNMHAEGSYPEPGPDGMPPPRVERRFDLAGVFISVVSTALRMMFVENLEVPYLWHYKRDAFSVLENQGQSSVQFLERDELWQLYTLGLRFRAIYARCEQITTMWGKIKEKKPDLENEYLTKTLLASVCMMSVEAAAEGYDWLAYHYPEEMKQIKEDEAIEEGLKRLPEKSRVEDMRTGPIMRFVEQYGISVSEVAVTFNDPGGEPNPPKNPDRLPKDIAEEFSGPETLFAGPDDAIHAASQIIISEMAKDPSIRQQARDFIEACGMVTVEPTDRGQTVIDEYHIYHTFKFLTNKPIAMFKDSPEFLHMLKAEEDGLITIHIEVSDEQVTQFSDTLVRCVKSNDYGEVATAWNELRKGICESVVGEYLIPAASKWARDHMRGQAEELVAEMCRRELEFRVNVRPYADSTMEQGETPSVLALTNGRGEVRDAVMAVMLDDGGNITTQTKFDNLKDEADRDALMDLVDRYKPNVVVVGGMSVHAAKLKDDIAAALKALAIRRSGENPPVSEAYQSHEEYQMAAADFDAKLTPYSIPLTWVSDATARIFMSSEEAEKDYPNLPVNGRYALGLARYTQNPLNAYCKLGRNLASITFLEHHQKLISNERLLVHLERGLVNAVCFMGIEVNSAVADAYQRTMLPFISGLGPRKADALVNAVLRQGTVINRLAYSDLGVFGPTILENVAGFLSIQSDERDFILEVDNPQDQPDPLDLTRIHPADYEFAQKMCQDALDLDAEDVADQHKSAVVLQLMQDDDRARKLGELNLDDFAFNLQKQGEGNKRHALGEIVSELISYRADRRPAFYVPSDWEVVTMLCGETERTVGMGLKVTATVRRALAARVFCQLESGLDAILEREYVSDDDHAVLSCEDQFRPRQSIRAVVLQAEPARMQVRISTRESDMRQGVPFLQPFRLDPYNDPAREAAATELAAQKKRRAAGKVKRVVNHPNWHVMNSGQAEQFLVNQHRGDVVIRPSSKGPDHLAVTWKVDEDIYQHIDVQEIDKPNEYSVGRILRVAGKYSYSDLDELIINHVKATARKFDEMESHEKYRPEDELESYLKNYVQAHPGRSMYGFSIDSERPGYLKLCFLNKSTKDGGAIQTWPVKVLPGAYQLNNAEVPGVTELCNAFKAQYSSRLSEQGGAGGAGGKTPGIRAGRTPMVGGRTPGGRTPGVGMAGMGGVMRGGQTPMYGMPPQQGRTPMRPGMTPNPYGGAPQQPVYGGGPGPNGRSMGYPPGLPGGPGQGYGGPPPPAPGPPGPGPNGYPARPPGPSMGMNPERAAMINRQGGRY